MPLPSAVVAMLRKHRTEQKADRLRVGNQWTDSGSVFTTAFGGPVDPRNLLRVIEVATKDSDEGDVVLECGGWRAVTIWRC